MAKQTWFSMAVGTGASVKRCTLSIFDEIGGWGVTPAMFSAQLCALGPVDEIELHLNSPGGSVIDGMAIYNLLNQHPATKTVYIDGWAASMASLLAMVGKDAPKMASNTWLMIHDPACGVFGGSGDLRQYANILDTMKTQFIGAYMRHCTLSAEEVGKLMTAETWLTAEEAAAIGLCSEVLPAFEAVALAGKDAFKGKLPAAEFLSTTTSTTTEEAPADVSDQTQTDKGGDAPGEPATPAADEAPIVATFTADEFRQKCEAAYDEGKLAGQADGAKVARADMTAQLDAAKIEAKAATDALAAANAATVKLTADIAAIEAAHKAEVVSLTTIHVAEVAGLSAKLAKLLPGLAFEPTTEDAGDYETKVAALVTGGMNKNDAILKVIQEHPSVHAAYLRRANRPTRN